jgi:hypothetical protein
MEGRFARMIIEPVIFPRTRDNGRTRRNIKEMIGFILVCYKLMKILNRSIVQAAKPRIDIVAAGFLSQGGSCVFYSSSSNLSVYTTHRFTDTKYRVSAMKSPDIIVQGVYKEAIWIWICFKNREMLFTGVKYPMHTTRVQFLPKLQAT